MDKEKYYYNSELTTWDDLQNDIQNLIAKTIVDIAEIGMEAEEFERCLDTLDRMMMIVSCNKDEFVYKLNR